MENFLTVRQVQDLLKVDRITVYRMLNDGRLKGIKIGQQWRFPQAEMDRFLGSEDTTQVSSSTNASFIDASFPTHCIQTIQNLFAEISGIGAVVVDLHGNNLTTFSRSCKFCTLMMTSPSGRAACQSCWKGAAEKSTTQNQFTCHAGMQFLAAPIHDQGIQIGALITGLFYLRQPDRQVEQTRIQQLAHQHHIDEAQLLAAAEDIQVIPDQMRSQVEQWPQHTVNAMHSILNERSGFLNRLQKIANLTQVY